MVVNSGVQTLMWIGVAGAAMLTVMAWMITNHSQHPHAGTISEATYNRDQANEREWRNELRADIKEIKRSLRAGGGQ